MLVQPVLLEAGQWLAPIFDLDRAPWPATVDPGWLQRTTALMLRQHAALNHRLVEQGWFDPLVFEADEAPPVDPFSPPPVPSAPGFEPLWPWVLGLQYALIKFPALDEIDDEGVVSTLDRLFRHLAAQTDEERRHQALIDSEHPLITLDEAIEDLVVNVVELFDLTHGARYKVDTMRREMPKVGRNHACPCGSGRKFKLCHGA